MRRFIAGLTVLAGVAALMAIPLASAGQPPKLGDQLRTGVNKTVGGVNDGLAGLRERLREEERKRREREAARRAAARNGAAPRAAAPDPQGQGYNPPLHGNNPHGQGTPATVDVPASTARPLPNTPAGGNGTGGNSEIAVAGRSRGEQNPDGGTYRGHITIAALLGNDIVPPLTTTPGQTRTFGPLQPVLGPLCNATQQSVCLGVLTATSTTTPTGSTNRFSAADAQVGGPTGVTATAASSNGNISQDASCQTAHGDSSVATAAVGTLTTDAIRSSSDSRQCKDGSQTQGNTSSVVNLQNNPVALPPLITAACANGVPNSPVLVPVVLPAICNADESNAAQALAPYGVREGLTTFGLAVGGGAVLKTTTAASESRAFIRAQCSDGIDNDGDGRIDFPNDPDCTGPTDDSEAGTAGAARLAQCEDGRDNDGDGRIDFPDDPGCTSRKDDSEVNRADDKAQCEDGRDNDGDGLVDFPDDPGCTSRDDDSEVNAGGAGAGGGGGGADDAGRGGGNRLAFTGTNLVLMFLVGSLALLAGLRIRALTGRRDANRAQRAGMA